VFGDKEKTNEKPVSNTNNQAPLIDLFSTPSVTTKPQTNVFSIDNAIFNAVPNNMQINTQQNVFQQNIGYGNNYVQPTQMYQPNMLQGNTNFQNPYYLQQPMDAFQNRNTMSYMNNNNVNNSNYLFNQPTNIEPRKIDSFNDLKVLKALI
jgi:hypothetical protein